MNSFFFNACVCVFTLSERGQSSEENSVQFQVWNVCRLQEHNFCIFDNCIQVSCVCCVALAFWAGTSKKSCVMDFDERNKLNWHSKVKKKLFFVINCPIPCMAGIFVFINHLCLCAAVVSQSQPQSNWLRP